MYTWIHCWQATISFVLQGLRNDFVRNIMWTFEDIHMLVGSNMPIFGGGRYPAVSLRLRLEFETVQSERNTYTDDN